MTSGVCALAEILKTAVYPICMRKVMVIRAGFVVQGLWKGAIHPVLKTVCSGVSLSKVHVCGSYACSWKELLCAEVGEANPTLPAFLTSDSSEACAAATPAGGLVPAATDADVAAPGGAGEDCGDDAADDLAVTEEPSSDVP